MKYLFVIFNCMLRQRGLHMQIKPYVLFGMLSIFYHERRKQKTRTLTENILKFVEYFGVGTLQERKIMYVGKHRYEIFQDIQSPTAFSFWISDKINMSC